jgi:hypothetical protein
MKKTAQKKEKPFIKTYVPFQANNHEIHKICSALHSWVLDRNKCHKYRSMDAHSKTQGGDSRRTVTRALRAADDCGLDRLREEKCVSEVNKHLNIV